MKYSKLHPDFFQRGGYSPVQFSSSEFIPTYAGAPLAEAQANAQQTAGIYHQNLADLTKIDMMNANRKIIDSPGDKAENDKINARLADQFQKITAKGDLENQTLQVNALLREYMNDPAQKALTESRANADREREFQEKARLAGKTTVLGNPAEGHQTIQYDEKGKPIYNVYQGTSQIKLDWQGKKSEIADKLKADAGPMTSAEIRAAAPSIAGYILTGKREGLSATKVGQMLEHMMTVYGGTDENIQERKVEFQNLMKQEPGLPDEMHAAETDAIVRQRMLSEGLLRVFNKEDADYITNWILKEQMDAKKKAEAPPVTPELEAMPGLNVPTAVGFDPENFDPVNPKTSLGKDYYTNKRHVLYSQDDKDKLGLLYRHEFNDKMKAEKGRTATDAEWEALKEEQRQKLIAEHGGTNTEQSKAYEDAAVKGARIFAQDGQQAATEVLNGSVDKNIKHDYAVKYYDMVSERMSYPTKSSYSTLGMDPAVGETATKAARQNIGNRLIYDLESGALIDTGAKNKGVVNPDFMKMVGGDLKNLTITGSINPKNPYGRITGNDRFGDAEEAQLIDKEGKVKTVLITKPEGHYKTAAGFTNKVTNYVWDNLALSPGSRKEVNVGGRKVDAMALPDPNDPSGASDRIVVFKIGNHDLTTDPEFADDIKASGTGGWVVPNGYDGIVNLILNLK